MVKAGRVSGEEGMVKEGRNDGRTDGRMVKKGRVKKGRVDGERWKEGW
jgi:hypothetical protein